MISDYLCLIRGGGDLGTGVALQLKRKGMPVVVFDLENPLAERRKVSLSSAIIDKKIEKDFSYKRAIFIGLFQMLSLMPGVSRSGIVITAARMSHFNRFDSAKISFLLSIPTLGAVSYTHLTLPTKAKV